MQNNAVRPPVVLAVVMAGSFITPFIGAAVNLALPHIARDFSLDAGPMSWVAMTYILASAVFLVPLGRAADILGRRRILFSGYLLMAISSLFCALAFDLASLLTARVLQGAASAMIFSTGMAILTDVFPASSRGRVIGYNVTAVYAGMALAPALGGFMISNLGWHSLFGFAAILSLVCAGLTHSFIRAEWREAARAPFDWTGAILYITAMTAFMYGFSHLPDTIPLVLATAGAAGLAAFAVLEARANSPLLNVRLLAGNRRFALSNLAALINYAMTFAVSFLLSLYLQYVHGHTPRKAGMVLIAQPLVMMIVAAVAGRLSDRMDSRILATAGMACSTAAIAFFAFLSESTGTAALYAGLALLGLGFGLFSSPNTHAIMNSVERCHWGTASSLVGTMRLTGQMLSMGIAALTLHAYVGQSPLGRHNVSALLSASRAVFFVFVILGAAGIAASAARGKSLSSGRASEEKA